MLSVVCKDALAFKQGLNISWIAVTTCVLMP